MVIYSTSTVSNEWCHYYSLYFSIEGHNLPVVMVKCDIWLSAAVISATPHHCIHLVVVQPPGVKVGWFGHAALQQHILSSLTPAYVGYTVMFQQSPPLLYSSSIYLSESIFPSASLPSRLLTYGLRFRLTAWVETVSLHLCHFPQARKVYSWLLLMSQSSWLSPSCMSTCCVLWCSSIAGFGDVWCCGFAHDATAWMSLSECFHSDRDALVWVIKGVPWQMR